MADVRLAIQNSPEYVFFSLVAQLWKTCVDAYARVYMYVFLGFRVVVCFAVMCIKMRVTCRCDIGAQLTLVLSTL